MVADDHQHNISNDKDDDQSKEELKPEGLKDTANRVQNRVLSNTNDIHWKWVCKNAFPYRTFKVEDYFEKTYLSYEMKMAKPEPEIFKAVTEDAGIDPKETFFIDDSEINCKVAQELGISTYTPKAGEDWSHLFRKK